ncbi:MAG: DUF5615 family PIN-like protein [Turneriella sp.]
MIRLYLDEDVHKQVALALRVRGYDVVSVHELEKWNLSDEEQLAFAVSNNRAIFTFNRGDFAKLHEQWLSEGRDHACIITSKQLNLSETIHKLNKFLFSRKSDEIKNQLIWL